MAGQRLHRRNYGGIAKETNEVSELDMCNRGDYQHYPQISQDVKIYPHNYVVSDYRLGAG